MNLATLQPQLGVVRLERRSDVRADLVLDRVDKLNALTIAGLERLAALVAELRARPPRVVVVRSATSRAFCVGADIAEQAELTPPGAFAASESGSAALDALASLPCPVVAAIDGHCLGGGWELALACDLRVATTRSHFAFPEASLGNTTGWGGLARLVAITGPACAKDLLLTGRPLTAGEALVYGLVDRVAGPDDLDAEVERLVSAIAKNAPLALYAAKRAIDALTSPPRHAGLAEALASSMHAASEDARRGKESLRTREQPIFEGR